jgi:hypothetical protein
MAVVCFFVNSMHLRLFGVSAEGHNFRTSWIASEVTKGRGNGVWYGIVVLGAWYPIPPSARIKFLVALNTTVILCVTLSDNIGGYLWASKLLRTCRVMKVSIPL